MESGDRMSGNFIYTRIYNDIRQRIESGQLQPGERLETEMELRERYNVSRETIRRALSLLESDGLIVRKVSSGTFVRAQKTQYSPSSYHESFTEQMRKQGKRPSSQIRSIEILTELPPQIAAALQLQPGERVYCVKRIRLADDSPKAYEIAYIRQSLCPNLHTRILDDTSLYQVYEEDYHLDMGVIALKMEAINADPSLQKLLNLKGPVAMLKMTSVMHLTDSTPLYYVICYHIGEKYEYNTTMPRRL